MKRQILSAAVWLTLSLFASTVDATGQTSNPSSTPSPSPSPAPVDVMYTGRLLGYFRVPSLQPLDSKRCPANPNANDYSNSYAAKVFLAQRQNRKDAVLVGTGDNFAPQLEARVFAGPVKRGDKYAVGNKELYYGKADGWEFFDSADPKLLEKIAEGHGIIPTDNVACFLRAAKFSAIVPGKHDFYFGAERLRQFARLLAAKEDVDEYRPVQMLAANLVLKTMRIDGATGEAKKQRAVGEWPEAFPIQNLNEGQSVYPWFSKVRIGLKNEHDFDRKDVYLCTSFGAPNQLHNNIDACRKLHSPKVERVDDEYVLTLTLPRLGPDGKSAKGGHFSTLIPGTNYGLCMEHENKKGCLRFSSHTPFFYFPHPAPFENEDGYTDPDPLFVDDRVAIFGVVDPDLSEQVGVLNFGWLNKQTDLKTVVSVEDPKEALQQQLDYFDELKPGFTGLKILLVQSSPQRARALAAKFPQFQMVVSSAEKEQSTSEVEMSTVWDPARQQRAFMAVPAPYFDPKTTAGSVYFSTVKATETSGKWTLKTVNPNEPGYVQPIEIKPQKDPATEFWTRVEDELKECLPANFKPKSDDKPEHKESLKWLVLCAMRDHTGADVALIQNRDLFDYIPLLQANDPMLARAKTGQSKGELDDYIQQTLDGLIWKGDLITLLYVPGGDLKKALERSDAYDKEERASLSLVLDKGRKLEVLGVRNDGDDHFINDLPLDEEKIYTVATTDYLAAGDTGYRDLVNAALNPRTHPAAFSGKLTAVSSLVCNRFFNTRSERLKYCLEQVESETYLDQTIARQTPPYKPSTFWGKTWKALGLEWPKSAKDAELTGDAVEQTVQRRSFWRFSLQDFSFGFKSLDHNFTEDELKEKFEGNPASGVTATESETFNFSLDTRLSRSSHKREIFFGSGFDFEQLSTADDPTDFEVSQIKNRVFEEIGIVFWRKPGRSLPNIGLNLSFYAETQFQHPYSVFTLKNDDPIRIDRDRSWLLLPRFGVRWQMKTNAVEVGVQGGRETKALLGYEFNGGTERCLADSGKTLQKCIEERSDPELGGTIRKDSDVTTLSSNRPRLGLYWKTAFSLPFTPRVKYELDDTGDFFFNFRGDTSVDTRFRSISKHRIGLVLWPSVSIGPTLELLLYKNKVNGDLLFQRQFGIETRISFDIFNRRETTVQLKNKP